MRFGTLSSIVVMEFLGPCLLGGGTAVIPEDDGRPPLEASGLTLHDRLSAMTMSLERIEKRGPCSRS